MLKKIVRVSFVILLGAGIALWGFSSCGITVRPENPTVKQAESWSPDRLEKDWDRFLKSFVSEDGLVDYAAIKKKPQQLDVVYAQLAEFSPDSHPSLFSSDEERFAYWLNAYNIAVVRGVIEHYPVGSVMEVKTSSPLSLLENGGFFVGQKFLFGGKGKDLYRLENSLIRKRYHDPRLHFALNCASGGCPELPQEAFQGDKLEEQLERETLKFMNSERAFQIDHEKEEMTVSQLFAWYREDFTAFLEKEGTPEETVLDYIARYLRGERLEEFKKARQQGYAQIDQEYDWSLNDSRSEVAAP